MLNKYKFAASYLVQWNEYMSTDRDGGQYDKVVYAFCKTNNIPVHHTNMYRDKYSYHKLWQQLEHYGDPKSLTLNKFLKFGFSSAFAVFARPRNEAKLQFKNVFKYRDVKSLILDLGIKNKSAGLTEFNTTKWGSINRSLQVIPLILRGLKAPAPVLAATRTQKNEKTRLVWAYPAEMTIIEAMVARPLISKFLKYDTPMTFGKYSATIGSRMRASISKNKYHTSIDYSQFDSTVSSIAIKYAFNAFRTWFDLSEVIFDNVTVGDLFDVIERYFITCPIVMPSRGQKYPSIVKGKSSGIPSGSYFTQLVGSFVNYANIMTVSKQLCLNLSEKDVYVLGDDCLFFSNKKTSLKRISSILSNYGFNVNPNKGSTGSSTEPINYLGRDWKNGIPVRTYEQIMDRALYPEKFRVYSKDLAGKVLNVKSLLHSYGLSAVVESPPYNWEQTSDAGGKLVMDSDHISGLLRFYISEGIIPRQLDNALY